MSKRNFKHTRELVKIALDDGMTQDEIRRACRVSQSTVSKWKNGKARASHDQLRPLIEKYGHRLQRATARTYLLDGSDGDGPLRINRVRGPIVFRYVFRRPAIRVQACFDGRMRGRALAQETYARWLIHELPGQLFVFVRQRRRERSRAVVVRDLRTAILSFGQRVDFKQCFETFEDAIDSLPQVNADRDTKLWNLVQEVVSDPWIKSADDAARWLSAVDQPRGVRELLAAADTHEYTSPEESLTVRFLIRKALVEHGHEVPELEPPPTGE